MTTTSIDAKRPPFLRSLPRIVSSSSTQSEDWNFGLSLQQQAAWSVRGEAAVDADTLMATTGSELPIAPYNAAIRLGHAPAPHVVEAAMDWFAARTRGFSLYVRSCTDADVEDECRRLGFRLCAILPVMTLAKVTAPDCDATPVTLTRVRTLRQVRDFRHVAAEAFRAHHVPTRVVMDAFGNASQILESSARLFLVSVQNQVAGCCQLLITEGTGGIYWISIRERFQRQGLATRMTRELVRYAMSEGAQKVVLQAAPTAVNLYHRLGFEVTSQLKCYCWPLRSRPRSRDAGHAHLVTG
jgi:ribosomal protein S18 acetylase RimI-like enzyme